MSSILKALKKLEEEQAGRAAVSPSPGSGGQFFAPAKAGRHPWLLLFCGAGLGLLLAGGGYYLLAGRTVAPPQEPAAPIDAVALPAQATPSVPVAAPERQLPAPPAARSTPAVVPSKANVAVATGTSPVAPPGVAAKAVPGHSATAAPVAQRPAAAATPAVKRSKTVPPSGQPIVSPPVPTPAQVEQVQMKHQEIPAPGQQWATSHLVVSDILPASGGERMAIVNGLPVMEGTMVEDAVVREIHSGQVIFEIDGKSVAVPLAARP